MVTRANLSPMAMYRYRVDRRLPQRHGAVFPVVALNFAGAAVDQLQVFTSRKRRAPGKTIEAFGILMDETAGA